MKRRAHCRVCNDHGYLIVPQQPAPGRRRHARMGCPNCGVPGPGLVRRGPPPVDEEPGQGDESTLPVRE